MNKPNRLKKGDKIAIISLSRGLLGEPFMAHQRTLIEERLQSYGLEVVYTPNALRGLEFLEKNPDQKAADLKWAFADPEIKMILCAIGGSDTFRTVPYLLEDPEFMKMVRDNPKIFIGYSDTSTNHLMFQKLGLMTFYGHSAIVDFGELGPDMLPYSKTWFDKLFAPEPMTAIEPSPIWYEERPNFGPEEFGKLRISHEEARGYELLSGSGIVEGELLGGCLETLGETLLGEFYNDWPKVNAAFELLPQKEGWKGKILFLETSESKSSPERLRQLLEALEQRGIFEAVNGVLIGKPQDETYYEEYKALYQEIIGKYGKPVLYNLNFGHAHPKCILPVGGKVRIDCDNLSVVIMEPLVN